MSDKTWTVAELLATTADFLSKKDSSSPRLEAELLLSRVLSLDRVHLYVNFDRIVTPEELTAYRELVKRRATHEPVSHILGQKEFYRLNFTVNTHTLIPRPETEHLVDETLLLAKAKLNQETGDQKAVVTMVDIGCGSGAIALSLAKNLTNAKIFASDISAQALAVAKENAKNLSLLTRVDFREGDLLAPFTENFDFILSNLPYIPTAEMKTLAPDVYDFEPHLALDGGPDGLDLFRKLLPEIPRHLTPGGFVLLEIHPPALETICTLARKVGLTPLDPVQDHSKKPRIFVAKITDPPEG